MSLFVERLPKAGFGIPLYISPEAVIPLSAALAAKGMGVGAVMAMALVIGIGIGIGYWLLVIGRAGESFTEVVLLKSICKNQMIAGFLYEFIF